MAWLKKLIIISLILLVSCSGLNVRNHYRRPSSKERISLPRMTESEFNKRLGKELDRHVNLIAERLSQPEASALQKFKRKALQFVVDANPWEHIKHTLIQHGKGAAITAAVTEIITVGILPAIFTAAGMPGAAAFSAGSPSFAITVPAFIAIKNARQKKMLARQLGFDNLKELDQLRKQILGFCTSKRIQSSIYQLGEEQIELTVIKRRFASWRRPPQGALVDLSKLREIGFKHLDSRIMEIVEPISKRDESVYATVLLDQIHQNPEASAEFEKHLKQNISGLPIQLTNHEQTMLLMVHEKQEHISLLKQKVRKFKKAATGEAKSAGILKEERKAIAEFAENMIADLETLDLDISRFEYQFLQAINLGEDVSEEVINNKSIDLLKRMRNFESALSEFETKMGNAEDVDVSTHMKRFVRSISQYNKTWIPNGVTPIRAEGSCNEIVTELIAS